jgi:CRP-like cAMP-binding protein
MHPRDLGLLASTALFRGVDLDTLERILGGASVPVRDFPKGSLLLLAGCSYDSLWVLLAGSVSADMQGWGGKTVRIETIAAPEPIATALLFAPEPALPVTVRALEEARAAAIPREEVVSLCQASRTFLGNYLRDSGSRIASFSERFRLLQFATLRERLADWLLRQAAKSRSDSVTLPASKEKLAEVFGVTRPSLSRGIGELARDGLIDSEGRVLRILDHRALEALLEQDGPR